jgi:hypothetical protein
LKKFKHVELKITNVSHTSNMKPKYYNDFFVIFVVGFKTIKVCCFILHIYIILFFMWILKKTYGFHFEFIPNIDFCDKIYILTQKYIS